MSIVTIKSAIVTALEGITGLGLVDAQEGRSSGLPWEDDVSPLWVVKISKAGRPDGHQGYLGADLYRYLFSIKGYYPWNYEQNSEASWDAYLELIRSSLPDSSTLVAACSQVDPVELLENDFVMYNAVGGAVLCHYGLLQLAVESWETQT